MISLDSSNVQGTIQQTIMTSSLFEGFWDRWIAHGLESEAAKQIRGKCRSLEQWIDQLNGYAFEYESKARSYHDRNMLREAEYFYRLSGFAYYLIQWIFPETCSQKQDWFSRCKERFRKADELASDEIVETTIQVDGQECFGRVRIPALPKGCIIIVNPIDSAKEELFTYELDFVKEGFVTVSFDGPGQGETYVFNQSKASRSCWALFVHHVIDFTASRFPDLPIHLFGTSSGAAWAIQGSCHPRVSKTVSVSPACHNTLLPGYFQGRMSYIVENLERGFLPKPEDFQRCGPILLFHGKKDVMVKDDDIHALYQKLPNRKRLIQYEQEGHCCNYKLGEIRKIAVEWMQGGDIRGV